MKNRSYLSKLFRIGNILLALTLAVRGIPRTWQPGVPAVTIQSGWAIYADEIRRLDALDPKLRIFQSGVLAAALVTTALDPRVFAFWELVNQERWTRHRDGRIDPPGWLLQQILRHSGNRDLALRPEYQHYLFQVSLAAAMAWLSALDAGQPLWLTGEPARVKIDELLEQVRTRKGLRRAPDGFRPPKDLLGRLPALTPTVIEHPMDLDLAMDMARAVRDLEPFGFEVGALDDARDVLDAMEIPSELGAPAVLTAALVSLARDPDRVGMWSDIFAGCWSHDPHEGSDTAGLITRAIQVANRREGGLPGQAQLFARAMMAIKTHDRLKRPGIVPRHKNIPKAQGDWVKPIIVAWSKITMTDIPVIHSCQVQPVIKGTADSLARQRCQNRKARRSRDETGARGERSFAQYHACRGLPRRGCLIDRTRDQCGWDYELDTEGEPLWVFEVKVVTGGIDCIIGERQWELAEELGTNYWLVLVEERPDADDEIRFIRNPYQWLQPERETRLVPHTTLKVKGRDLKKVATDDVESLLQQSEALSVDDFEASDD